MTLSVPSATRPAPRAKSPQLTDGISLSVLLSTSIAQLLERIEALEAGAAVITLPVAPSAGSYLPTGLTVVPNSTSYSPTGLTPVPGRAGSYLTTGAAA